ncbi:Mce protein [Mycolicibacterium sp. CH28]|uniref:Mce protein n=1 Tax=Mycolicibacterium sp. CH28 TaxID=2512237 RepID=UPI001080CF07|nr:Mce protein [Mycolicibacterium sp. CH28]TGD89912.1 Mce protein [Mycolicibacterium sp. CH28]
MEDQQPSAGDLTDVTPGDEAPADDAVETDAAETEPAETEAEAGTEPAPQRNWLSRNKTAVALGTSAALFVGAGAFAGATLAPYLMDRATVDTKLDIATTAAEAITTLWTYTPDNMEALPDRSAKYLSGDFQEQYRKYVDAIVPANKQAKVTNTTEVVGAAVESLNASEASAIVYTNTTSTSPLSKNIPAMRYLSYRLQLKQAGARWLVTKMTTVTSLDLTPQI